MSEAETIKEVISGHSESYSEIINTYQSPLRRYVLYLLHDPDATEDVLQDTFIKAYQNLAGYNSKYKFSSWIYRIAHNTAMDSARSVHTIPLDDELIEKLSSVEPKLAERIDKEILTKDVQKCLGELPDKYKSPVLLHYMSDKSYREVSDILRIPIATVGVRINRAKARLKEVCKRLEVNS